MEVDREEGSNFAKYIAGITPTVEFLKNVGGYNGSFLWDMNRTTVLLSFKTE